MEKVEKDNLFKKGIWIKEQNGSLTIGSLDKNETSVKIIPEGLRDTLVQFETDMIDALYGEKAAAYIPSAIDVGNLLKNLSKKYQKNNIRVALSGTENNVFKGEYDKIYEIIDQLVKSSLPASSEGNDAPVIYINASLIDNHLCLIYRDSASICHPSKLKKVIQYIQTNLKGEISYKAVEGEKSYFDIMLPSIEL